jgi:hypothetical protein
MRRLLRDAELARRMGANGRAFVAEHGGTTARLADAIVRRLESLP